MYRDVWRALAKERNLTIVDEYSSTDYQPDFRSILPRILAKNPEMIFIAHEPQSSVKALRQLGYSGTIAFANNVLEVMLGEAAPPGGFEGVYFVDVVTSDDFKARFMAKWGEAPILEAHSIYETVRSTARAASLERGNLSAGMKKVTYEGVAGPLDFSASCSGNGSKWRLMRFTSTSFEQVREGWGASKSRLVSRHLVRRPRDGTALAWTLVCLETLFRFPR